MTKPLIMDHRGNPLSSSQQTASSSRGRPIPSYEAGDPLSEELAGWHPGLHSADADWLYERDDVVARVRDLVRNNGWAAGAVRRECESVIGSQIRLNYKPDYRVLGLSADWAAEFASVVEAQWRSYAIDPGFYADAERHLTVPAQFGLAYRHNAIDGDALGVLHWTNRRPNGYQTSLQIVDPDRLSNPYDEPDRDRLRGGVELDEHGAATAYHIRKRHPFDIGYDSAEAYEWVRIPRETKWGRPKVVHYFDKERAGETRGKSRLASVVEPLKMDHKLGKAELGAAVLNAILAAFIESPFDPSMVEQGFAAGDAAQKYHTEREEFHANSRLSLGGVRIKHLFPGEKFTMNAATRPSGAFEPFEMAVLRKVASGLGTSYEQLTQDWSRTNYSSARAALLEVWRGFTDRRALFTQRFCTPVFAAWLEEAIDLGQIILPSDAPDFYEARAAWTRCRWIGPARGWVDPTKEADAAASRMSYGISTLDIECAEQGYDWEENAVQQSREMKFRKKMGLPMAEAPKGNKEPAQTDEERKDAGSD